MTVKQRLQQTQTNYENLRAAYEERHNMSQKCQAEMAEIEKQLLVTKGEYEAYQQILQDPDTAAVAAIDKEEGFTEAEQIEE